MDNFQAGGCVDVFTANITCIHGYRVVAATRRPTEQCIEKGSDLFSKASCYNRDLFCIRCKFFDIINEPQGRG